MGSEYRVLHPTASARIKDASSLAFSRQLYDQSASGPFTIPGPGSFAWENMSKLSPSMCLAQDKTSTTDWSGLVHKPLRYLHNYQKEDPCKSHPPYSPVAQHSPHLLRQRRRGPFSSTQINSPNPRRWSSPLSPSAANAIASCNER